MTCPRCHGSGFLPGVQDSKKGRTYNYLLGLRVCPCTWGAGRATTDKASEPGVNRK